MTARGPRLILSALVAVAIMLPHFRFATTADASAGHHSLRHRPIQQRRVAVVTEFRNAQTLGARVVSSRRSSRGSRASQPRLLSSAYYAALGSTMSRLFFPLRC